MAGGGPNFRDWLTAHKLHRFHDQLVENAFESVSDFVGLSDADLNQLSDELELKLGHRSRLRKAVAGIPGSFAGQSKMVAIDKEESPAMAKLKAIDERSRAVDESSRECQQQILIAFEHLSSLVDERKEQLVAEVIYETKVKKKSLDTQKLTVNSAIKAFTQTDSELDAELAKIPDMDLTSEFKFLAENPLDDTILEFGTILGSKVSIPPEIVSIISQAESAEISWKPSNRYNKKFMLSWRISEEKGEDVPLGKETREEFNANITKTTLEGLQPKKHYSVKIRSKTDFGWGAFSTYKTFNTAVRSFKGSTLLDAKSGAKLEEFLGDLKTDKLLYKASLHGFCGSNFHERCDSIGPTLTVIKRNGFAHVYGGYTATHWDSRSGNKRDDKFRSFVFTMFDDDGNPAKFQHKAVADRAISCDSFYGPIFGSKYDWTCIFICNECDRSTGSKTEANETYAVPTQTTLCGQRDGYTIDDIEVFSVHRT